MVYNYWSPSDSNPTNTQTIFGDGGVLQNVPIINFLQRRVKKILFVSSSSTPLQPLKVWDVAEETSKSKTAYKNIAIDLSALFGALPSDYYSSTNFYDNQVFDYADYKKVVIGLQQAQQQGKGIIATFTLTTIENKRWGIPAGINSEITFWLLGNYYIIV